MFRNNILLISILALTSLVGCASAEFSNLKKTEVESVWYLVSTNMRQRGKPYLGYKISDQFYSESLAHRFPVLDRSMIFSHPDELLLQLRDSGYKAELIIKRGVIFSRLNLPGINGFVLMKGNNKLPYSEEVGVTMKCLKYEIPRIKPVRYGEDCFVNDSALRGLGLRAIP